ncbi:hypothetical protein ABH935_006711 [Catenulispora sp. GAS73]|uniref:hypothetical protein n=1 Tax=Catenulispora sp. GAS73 TaxID=3156269 RepID=UPI003513C8DD
MLPGGAYSAAVGIADQAPIEPSAATTEDQRRDECSNHQGPEAAVAAPAPRAPARVGTWTPRVITGLVAEPVDADRPAAVDDGGPRFAAGMNVLLQLLTTAGRPMRARELAQALGREPTTSQLESIRQSLRGCVERGQALLVEPGMWAIAAPLLAGGRVGGDLRRLRSQADGDPARIRELLQEFPHIGPVGADIFCREVQGIWPEVRPAFDRRALKGAEMNRLPKEVTRLEALVAPKDLPRLAAALVRSTV